MKSKEQIFIILLLLFLVSCQMYRDQSATKEENIQNELPPFLGFVLPEIGSTYSISDYEKLAPSLEGWGATRPGICFSIWAFYFMEEGDFPTPEEWLDKISFSVDDQEIEDYHSLLETDSPGRFYMDPVSELVLWKEPGGSPYCLCYAISLKKGDHMAKISVEKSSGEIGEFSWHFRITK